MGSLLLIRNPTITQITQWNRHMLSWNITERHGLKIELDSDYSPQHDRPTHKQKPAVNASAINLYDENTDVDITYLIANTYGVSR